ncbi:luciferase family protein [Nonomuraea sp. NPDC050643]|uniref:luciferase domain-containing protein n=1 Tax=Nonomuraea sp. NPDC050643 TaxID=3155660 RepID=UPI003400CE33
MAGITAWRRGAERRGPYVARAVAELRSWPVLAVSDTRRGTAFAVRGTEILRLAGADRVQVRLTVPAIDRLEPYLGACDQVRTCPDRAWVAVQVDAEPDLELLLALTSVAIKAHVPGEL